MMIWTMHQMEEPLQFESFVVEDLTGLNVMLQSNGFHLL